MTSGLPFRVSAFAFLLAVASAGTAQDYPSRPVRMVSPFPPGGSVDLVARLVAVKLTEFLGQQVVVENRSGASGNIGTELVARAAPDGYTLLINTIPFVSNAFLYSKLPYDPLNDFAPVMLLSSSQTLLAVHPSLPVRSVRELLALARSKPGELNYASAGPATNPHIAGELFNLLGKVNIQVVHFKGGGPGLIATMSGEVGIAFTNFSETSAHVRAGRLRALGVSGTKRVPAMPDIPTIAEAGLPGYEFSTWQGIWAPRGTPKAVVALLNDRLKKTMAAPDQVKRFEDRGLDIIASSPEEFSAHVESEYKKWGRVIRERGMKAE
ncbi:MAG TPA: tripartite tricarboxylate transporter substrate binding protein [Burkholderiales bacterium]|nr:tripartite tricarboxylate transporter substrate binding protein [Burkholderiales bacterium]